MSLLDQIKAAISGILGRAGIDQGNVAVGIAIGLVSFFGTIAFTAAVLVRLPPDYITNEHPKRPARGDIRARVGLFLRHIAGVLLILLGLILMLPGVPGQGLLTVIAGLFISEIPGTGRLLRRILRSPKVLSAVNALRARYKHPPLAANAPPDAPPNAPADAPPKSGATG